MRFFFHPFAEKELEESVSYYDKCSTGLGLEFAEEVYATIKRILEYPDAWPKFSKNSRRCLVNRFPYGIIFQIKANMIRIIAVANLHRHPDYWKHRK